MAYCGVWRWGIPWSDSSIPVHPRVPFLKRHRIANADARARNTIRREMDKKLALKAGIKYKIGVLALEFFLK